MLSEYPPSFVGQTISAARLRFDPPEVLASLRTAAIHEHRLAFLGLLDVPLQH
jgi:hypothetical protein